MKKSQSTEKKTSETKARKSKALTAKASKKRIVFEYQGNPGQTVQLAGSFNDWNPESKPMTDKEGIGQFRCILMLLPGSYEYKFCVDGQWMADPNNRNFVPNCHGSLNSIIVVE